MNYFFGKCKFFVLLFFIYYFCFIFNSYYMNRIICIVILCLWGFMAEGRAQTSLRELIDKMSDSDRKEYFENAKHYIETTYYNQLFATFFDCSTHSYVVEDLMAEDVAQCKPEILWKGGECRFLSPMEYMYCLNREYRELNADELEFTVNNINFSPEILPYSVSGFRVWADYDLEVRYQSRVLLKHRCRMYCLFPQYFVKTRIRMLQVEPLSDFAEDQPLSSIAISSEEECYNEAILWYEQKEKYLPLLRELTENGYTEVIERNTKTAEQGEGDTTKALRRLKFEKAVSDYDKRLYSSAFPVFKELAELGDSYAQNYTGLCYDYGLGITEDKTEALEWYTKAAEQGVADAQFKLGTCYFFGRGISIDCCKMVY